MVWRSLKFPVIKKVEFNDSTRWQKSTRETLYACINPRNLLVHQLVWWGKTSFPYMQFIWQCHVTSSFSWESSFLSIQNYTTELCFFEEWMISPDDKSNAIVQFHQQFTHARITNLPWIWGITWMGSMQGQLHTAVLTNRSLLDDCLPNWNVRVPASCTMVVCLQPC